MAEASSVCGAGVLSVQFQFQSSLPLADFLFAQNPHGSKLTTHVHPFSSIRPMNEKTRNEGRSDRERRDRQASNEVKKPRRRRWPWVFVVLIALVYFLPTIVAQTSLKQSAINWALADFKGDVAVDSISIGWFSSTQLNGLKANDEQGQLLLEVAQIRVAKSLLGLLTTANDYGKVEIQSPIVHLQLRSDGSNLEDALAEYLKDTDEPASPLPRIQLEVEQGRVNLVSDSAPNSWLVDEIQLTSEIGGDEAAIIGTLAAQVSTEEQEAGFLNVDLKLDSGERQIQVNNGHVTLQSQCVPASVLAPVVQRMIGPCSAIGEINGQATVDFQSGGNEVAADLKQLEVTRFAMVAPQILQGDQLSMNRLTANGKLNFTSAGIHAERFLTESDVGKVETDGTIDLTQFTSLMSGEVPSSEFSAHGELDVARLANMLPKTFSLHEDLKVQSGTVTFDAVTRNDAGVRRLLVDLTASNLTAQRGGQFLSWHKPFRLSARVGQTEGQLVLENVKCESDFLTVEGAANSEVGNFVAQGDLSQLRENLSQFVDLTGVDLAGKLGGEFGWSFRSADGEAPPQGAGRPIQVGGKFEIEQPVIQTPGMPRWTAPQLSLVGNAMGAKMSDGTISIQSGGARAIADQEVLTIRLAEPVADIASAESLTLNCDLSGRLEGWLAHVRNFIWIGDFDASGQVVASSPATVSWEKIRLTGLNYSIELMKFDGYGASFNEPTVTGDGKLSYDLRNGLIYVPVLNLASSSVSARANEIQATVTDVITMSGDVLFRADVNRVSYWYGLSPEQDSVNWFGTAEGNVKLTSDQKHITGQLTGVIRDLVAAQRVQSAAADGEGPMRTVSHGNSWSELFRENQVKVSSNILVAQDFNSVGFQGADISASAVQLSGQGSIGDLETTWKTEFQGEWNPDWEKVKGLLSAYSYDTVQLTGSGRQSFDVSGPLFSESSSQNETAWLPPELRVRTQFEWDAGEILKLPLGASGINLDLNQSVAFLQTGQIPFVGGTINAAPMIDLRNEEPVLWMEEGVLLENVNLSSGVCRDLLKYVMPLVADATEAQGRFSVQHDRCQIPLYDPAQAQLRGKLQLHEGTIGAGPLAKQLFSTVSQVKQLLKPGSTLGQQSTVWIDLGNQEIPFAVQNGRVYHSGIKLRVDDVTVETEGFVGIDQSLNLNARIPIQDDWLGDNRWLAGLRGQFLQIPISGTITEPRLDTRAVQQLSQQLVQQAAGNAINGAIQDQVGEIQNKLGDELNGARNKLQEKLNDEFQKGLEGIFKRK